MDRTEAAIDQITRSLRALIPADEIPNYAVPIGFIFAAGASPEQIIRFAQEVARGDR